MVPRWDPGSGPIWYRSGVYGLINVAVRDLITSRFGDDAWASICQKSGVGDEAFIRMDQHDDAITYGLVGAAAEVLDITPSEVLQAFGEYWTTFTGDEGYGPLLDAAGDTLPELLQNLDAMHTRVGTMYPDFKPPSFECTDVTDASMDLHYRSSRDGLDDLVIGLLRGLGRRFGVEVHIKQIASKGDGSDHSIFHVQWH